MPEKKQTPSSAGPAKFDPYVKDYERWIRKSIATSGEPPAYFADYKVECINRLVGSDYDEPILDYGCGVGIITERLLGRFSQVSAFDLSDASVAEAKKRATSATFFGHREAIPKAHFGIIVLSNVLHHVLPADRVALVSSVVECLLPDRGRLVVFEHNPYNPLTRRAVTSCEFDDVAMLLGPIEVTRLLTRAGLVGVSRKFIVFFPRALAGLRGFEPRLGWLPFGAQVMAVGMAPARAR